MLKKVEVVSDLNGNVLRSFDIADNQGRSEYQITNIEGLDPVSASISSQSYAQDPGAFTTGVKIGGRNIVIHLKLRPVNPNTTIMSLRHSLYRAFEVGNLIWLRLHFDGADTMQILGRVESNTFNPFTPDAVHQISVFCELPYFQSLRRLTLTGDTNTPLQVYGYSNAPTPFQVKVLLNKKVDRLRVWVGDKEGLMVNTENISAGDTLWLSTEPQNKFIRSGAPGRWVNRVNQLYSGGLDTTFGEVNVGSMNIKTDPVVTGNPIEVTFVPRWVGV